MLASGVAPATCDKLRPLLERTGHALTASQHLKCYVPKIEAKELALINSELCDEYVGFSFDGTTRLGEAVNTTGRWCSVIFEIKMRLVDFTTLKLHMNAQRTN